jgi:BolA protein
VEFFRLFVGQLARKDLVLSIQETITSKLERAFAPHFLLVENESHNHSVAPGSESHFRVIVVSSEFNGKSRIVRQQAVYKVLADEFQQGLHALSQFTYTAEEWALRQEVPHSPVCASKQK